MSAKVKEAANSCYEAGLNVVPVDVKGKDKKPLVEWKKWQTQRQTREEFDNLPFEKANAFGVICGQKLNNGLFLGAVDFDVKNLENQAIEKGRETLAEFPVTQSEETPSKGQHWIYYSHVKPKSVSVYHNEVALELIGQGKLCIMAPSQGYRRLNGNETTIIEDLEDAFYKALNAVGVQAERAIETWFDSEDLSENAYGGDNPPCIKQILNGVPEGLRNEAAIRLSSYLVNFRQLDPKKAFDKIQFWNKLNEPSLSARELQKIFKSAIKGEYVFGCTDDVLRRYCNNQTRCPMRRKPESQTEKKTPNPETERRMEAELQRILDADNQLEALMPHINNLAVGDETIKKIIAVLLLGSKYSSPEMKVLILLKSDSGAGKTMITSIMITGYKVKTVGRFSAHAIDHSDIGDYEILSLQEFGYIDDEKQGVSTIKFLSSDDCGYTVEVTGERDADTGRFTTYQNKIPPITVISSTTRLMVDKQFERRAWLLSLDESEEQTERIARFNAKQEIQRYEKLSGKRVLTDKEFSTEIISRFIAGFQPVGVVVPFPYTLNKTLGFSDLRARGDFKKLQVFCQLYGAMNRTRLVKLAENLYELTPEVAVEALNIALEPMSSMLVKIDDRTRALLNALKKLRDVKTTFVGGESTETEIRYDRKGSQITKEIQEKLALILNKAPRTVYAYFNDWEKSAGLVNGDDKKPRTFTLLFDVDEIERKLGVLSAKIKSADVLMGEMRKEAQNYEGLGFAGVSVRTGDRVPEPSPLIGNRIPPARTEKVANPELSPLYASSAKTQADNLQNGGLQTNREDNPTPRKMILLPRDMCSLRAEVKSPFSKKQFMDCLKKFGFESFDADMKFDEMEKQGHFYPVDIDKTRFHWTYD